MLYFVLGVIYSCVAMIIICFVASSGVIEAKTLIAGYAIGMLIGLVISKYRKGVKVFSDIVYINHEYGIYKYEYYFKSHPLNKLKINREIKKAKSDMTPVAYTVINELEGVGIARDSHTHYDFVVNKVNGRWAADEGKRRD